MTRASITELKAQLSRYLREVRRGGEVQVLDRGVPVARIIGITSEAAGDDDGRRRRLVEAGVLRPGSGDASAILSTEPLALDSRIGEALQELREDRV